MYLFKCKCGCLFTIKSFKRGVTTNIKCYNCGTSLSLYEELEIQELEQNLDEIGMTLQVIPDNAKISVTFDA